MTQTTRVICYFVLHGHVLLLRSYSLCYLMRAMTVSQIVKCKELWKPILFLRPFVSLTLSAILLILNVVSFRHKDIADDNFYSFLINDIICLAMALYFILHSSIYFATMFTENRRLNETNGSLSVISPVPAIALFWAALFRGRDGINITIALLAIVISKFLASGLQYEILTIVV